MTTKEELNIYIIVKTDKIKTEYEKNIDQLVQKYNSGKINFAVYSSQKEALDKNRREDISKLNTINKIPNNLLEYNYIKSIEKSVYNIKVKNI